MPFFTRGFIVLALTCVLVVLLFGAGAIDGDPSYADEKDLITSYNAHVGEQAEVDGHIVATDPIRIEIEYGPETLELTVVNVDEPVETGENLRVFGTVADDRVIHAETTVVRQPWELWYVYGISIVGGFWVLARVANGWWLDRSDLTAMPRETTLTTAWLDSVGGKRNDRDSGETTGSGDRNG